MTLTRAQFKVLQMFHRYNGDIAAVTYESARNPGITEADLELALYLFSLAQGEEG